MNAQAIDDLRAKRDTAEMTPSGPAYSAPPALAREKSAMTGRTKAGRRAISLPCGSRLS
jgi:hypothetical protein